MAKSVSSLGRISEGSWGEMSQISQAATEGSAEAEGGDEDLFDGPKPTKRPSGGWGKWQAHFP